MNKKGQITIFIIVGVIILLLAAGFFVLRSDTTLIDDEVIVKSLEPKELETFVEACITKVSEQPIKQITTNGGTLTLDNAKLYQSTKYHYLCNYENGCINNFITRSSMERELNNFLANELNKCIDLKTFQDQLYKVTKGDIEVQTTIAVDDIEVKLFYPITLEKDSFSLTLKEFSKKIESPLGKLFDLANMILNEEIVDTFDQDEWMFAHGKEIAINKHRPYPDIVYQLKINNQEFNFALQGRDNAALIGDPSQTQKPPFSGWCRLERDNTCYANVKEEVCTGTFTQSKPDDCTGSTQFSEESCNGKRCKDCGIRQHGESWCNYDGITGNGFDYVGSRHHKVSCFDGEIFYEECTDFREDVCTEKTTGIGTKAVCRPNRWQDCSAQLDRSSCTDSSKRDCTWSDWLVNEDIKSLGMQRENRRCHPEVPPGFRFWASEGGDICSLGTEQRECDGFSCPQIWIDNTALYCTFQGDCGNYRNYVDEKTEGGYFSTDTPPREYTFLKDGLTTKSYTLNLRQDVSELPQITSQTYKNPGHETSDLYDGFLSWSERASKWEVCDFCDCIFGTPIGNCNFDESIYASASCSPTNAPEKGQCDVCQKYPAKPCSEYRCKSIGTNCAYQEQDGTGICFDASATDGQGPTIFLDKELNKLKSIEDVFLDIEGVHIQPALEPYSMLELTFSISELASCKLSPFPNSKYSEIPGAGSSFSSQYSYKERVIPADELREQLKKIMDISSPLELSIFQTYDRKFKQTIANLRSMLDNFAEFTSNSDQEQKIAEVERKWDLAKPIVEAFYNEWGVIVRNLIIQFESKNFLWFIRCIDQAGNENEQQFFFKYTIADDTKPPVIEKITPAEGAFIIGDNISLTLFLNEPAECRYSDRDKAFAEMTDELDCATSSFDLDNNNYLCTKEIPFVGIESYTLNIKCRDQPSNEETFYLNLTTSNNFEKQISFYGAPAVELINNTINITDVRQIENPTTLIGINRSEIQVSLNFKNPRICKFTTTEQKYEYIAESFACSGKVCKVDLFPDDYIFKCISADFTPGNINSKSFSVTYKK